MVGILPVVALLLLTPDGPPPQTPLVRAARTGEVDALRALIAAGARVDERDPGGRGWTPLFHAIHKRQAGAVHTLLEAGADPNLRLERGGTPLMYAAAYGDVAIVRDLLEHGADPRARRRNGLDALSNAAGEAWFFDPTDGPPLGTCHPEVVRELLAHAPDLTLKLGAGPVRRVARWLGAYRGCPEAFALLGERAPQ